MPYGTEFATNGRYRARESAALAQQRQQASLDQNQFSQSMAEQAQRQRLYQDRYNAIQATSYGVPPDVDAVRGFAERQERWLREPKLPDSFVERIHSLDPQTREDFRQHAVTQEPYTVEEFQQFSPTMSYEDYLQAYGWAKVVGARGPLRVPVESRVKVLQKKLVNGNYDEMGAKLKRDHLSALNALRKQRRKLFRNRPEEYEDMLEQWFDGVGDSDLDNYEVHVPTVDETIQENTGIHVNKKTGKETPMIRNVRSGVPQLTEMTEAPDEESEAVRNDKKHIYSLSKGDKGPWVRINPDGSRTTIRATPDPNDMSNAENYMKAYLATQKALIGEMPDTDDTAPTRNEILERMAEEGLDVSAKIGKGAAAAGKMPISTGEIVARGQQLYDQQVGGLRQFGFPIPEGDKPPIPEGAELPRPQSPADFESMDIQVGDQFYDVHEGKVRIRHQ